MSNTVGVIIENAERLYADGIRVRTLGSLRTASSLFILAMEEAGKACLVRWLDFGYDQEKILQEIRTGHVEKQLVYLAYIYIKCLKAVGEIIQAGPSPKNFGFNPRADNVREALAKEIF